MSIKNKRITQETFDEVVRENIEDFDMNQEDAINDAKQQFLKQGVDLSLVDFSGGIGKEEYMQCVHNLQQSIAKSDCDKILSSLHDLLELTNENYEHFQRNLRFIHSDGTLNSIHALISLETVNDKSIEYIPVVIAAMDAIKLFSRMSIDIRDFFEPNGSKNTCSIISNELDKENPNEKLLLAALSLCRIVAKSEDNKVALMKNGLGYTVTRILGSDKDFLLSEKNEIQRECCYVMKGLCLHDDIRRDMSCAYDNGKFFINSPITAKALMSCSCEFIKDPLLASAALSAARSLITTEESVKVMTQHGAMDLPKAILSYENATIELTRSVLGLMRNLCADDIRKDKLVADGTLELMIRALANEKYIVDSKIIEHGLACFAAMSLRSPSNSSRIVSFGSIEVIVNCMRKFSDKTALQRQGCLLIRNIAARCPELRNILLDGGVENILRSAGRFQDCIDEAYGALRDLECEVQRVKVNADGTVQPLYEQFGSASNSRFNPVFEESSIIHQRIQQEARAPFAHDDHEEEELNEPCCENHNNIDTNHDHNHDHTHNV